MRDFNILKNKYVKRNKSTQLQQKTNLIDDSDNDVKNKHSFDSDSDWKSETDHFASSISCSDANKSVIQEENKISTK